MIDDNIKRCLESIRQLHMKKGPYYDKWLKNYKKSVMDHCVKIADHYKQQYWLQGMQRFLYYEQTRRNKHVKT